MTNEKDKEVTYSMNILKYPDVNESEIFWKYCNEGNLPCIRIYPDHEGFDMIDIDCLPMFHEHDDDMEPDEFFASLERVKHVPSTMLPLVALYSLYTEIVQLPASKRSFVSGSNNGCGLVLSEHSELITKRLYEYFISIREDYYRIMGGIL